MGSLLCLVLLKASFRQDSIRVETERTFLGIRRKLRPWPVSFRRHSIRIVGTGIRILRCEDPLRV